MRNFWIVLSIIVVAIALYQLYFYFLRKNTVTELEGEEFNKDLRRVQLIDVREPQEFESAHILGARNIPYSQFNQRMAEIRKDKPVYLYDTGVNIAARAARKLKKNGYNDLYILKGGFNDWQGRTKTKS